jgi:hypothetical protein
MKQLTLLLGALCLFLASARAQTNNVGIGTTTPAASALLDVSSTTKGLLAPRMTKTQRDAITTPATGLLVYQTDNTPGFYTYNGTAWVALSDGASQLEKITENSKTGHRILGRNAAYYGNIGTDAVDLSYSYSEEPNTTNGATGDYSTAMGSGTTASGTAATAIGFNNTASGTAATVMGNGNLASGIGATAMGSITSASGNGATAMGNNTTAKSYAEVALGAFNTSYTPASTTAINAADRAFGIGIGTLTTPKDGLILYKDGTLFLNKLTAAPTTTTDRFYVLNNKLNYNGAEVGSASQLEKLTENSKTGHRILGRDAANYGDIGADAIDLSLSASASTTRGATGSYSTATGYNTTASATFSTAMGYNNTASAYSSTAMGNSTTASGQYSTAMGNSTTASGDYSTAMGSSTTASDYYSTAMGYNTTASKQYCIAMGAYSNASAYSSTAIGYTTTASGQYSTAMGNSTTASAFNSTAIGYTTTASGQYSTAMGYYTTASGEYSTAMGRNTTASGSSSTAMGDNTTAKSHAEVALGTYNTSYTPVSTNSSNTADRAFGVGIGTSSVALKDGLILYKDGTLFLNKLTAAPTTTTDRIYNVSNVLYINGTVVGTQTSDARYKERVEDLPSALANIKKLRPVSYYWKDQKWGAQKEIGFIAQELKAKYPEVVVTDTDGYHKVNYGVLTAVLTKGMQEQQLQIEALVTKNEQLEKENAALKAQLSGFADRLGSIEKALNGGAKTIVNNAEASVKK